MTETPEVTRERRSQQQKRNRAFLFAALLVAALAFVVITAGGIGKNLVYYWSPSQLRAAGNKAYGATIRLGGMVKKGTVVTGQGVSNLEFDVTDYKDSVHVKATGMPPQMFREGIGVVIEGTMDKGGWFRGDKLMVSHNNEYRAPKPGEAYDVEKAIKTTVGVAPEGKK